MGDFQNIQCGEVLSNKQMSSGQYAASHLSGEMYDNFMLDLNSSETFHTKNCELTQRKLEYLQLVAIGLSNEDIANTLFVSVSTVKTTLEALFKALSAINRTDAVSIAIMHQLFPIDYRSSIVQKYPIAKKLYLQKLFKRDF